MIDGSQWMAIWYRLYDMKLICYETAPGMEAQVAMVLPIVIRQLPIGSLGNMKFKCLWERYGKSLDVFQLLAYLQP